MADPEAHQDSLLSLPIMGAESSADGRLQNGGRRVLVGKIDIGPV